MKTEVFTGENHRLRPCPECGGKTQLHLTVVTLDDGKQKGRFCVFCKDGLENCSVFECDEKVQDPDTAVAVYNREAEKHMLKEKGLYYAR